MPLPWIDLDGLHKRHLMLDLRSKTSVVSNLLLRDIMNGRFIHWSLNPPAPSDFFMLSRILSNGEDVLQVELAWSRM